MPMPASWVLSESSIYRYQLVTTLYHSRFTHHVLLVRTTYENRHKVNNDHCHFANGIELSPPTSIITVNAQSFRRWIWFDFNINYALIRRLSRRRKSGRPNLATTGQHKNSRRTIVARLSLLAGLTLTASRFTTQHNVTPSNNRIWYTFLRPTGVSSESGVIDERSRFSEQKIVYVKQRENKIWDAG